MRTLVCCLSISLLLAAPAFAQEADLAEEVRALREKVQKLEKRLAELERKLEKPDCLNAGIPGAFVPRKGDREAVRKVSLPENPTKENVREYVRAVFVAMGDKNSFSRSDLEVQKLAQVGPEHVDVLIDALSDQDHFGPFSMGDCYLVWTLDLLVRESHKELVLSRLAACHDLVEIVQGRDWAEDARPTLLAVLKSLPTHVPTEWIDAVASLRDPATYPLLREYLVRGSNTIWTWKSIRDLPGIEIEDAVSKGWDRHRSGRANSWDRSQFAVIAMYYGHVDALGLLIDTLGKGGGASSNDYGRHVFRHIDFVGTPDEVRTWFWENSEKLVFDPETRVFKVRE